MKKTSFQRILATLSTNKALIMAISISMFAGYYALGLNQLSDVKVPVKETPIAMGKTIYESKCGKCHKLFEPKKFNAAQWTKWVDRMAPKAKLTPEEKELVYNYLTNDLK